MKMQDDEALAIAEAARASEIVGSFARGGERYRGERVMAAVGFAAAAHFGVLRKWSFEHYVLHPIRVALVVDAVLEASGKPHDALMREEAFIAAVLHDVVEDTPTTVGDLGSKFSAWVADTVGSLTNAPRSAGSRAVRHTLNVSRLAHAGRYAQAIKCADIAENVPSIVSHDPTFEMLGVLTMAPDVLWSSADAALTAAEAVLKEGKAR